MNPSQAIRLVRIGARALLMHKLRTLLSVLGIIFGVAAVVSMLSIGEGAKQEAVRQIGQLGAHNVIVRRVKLSPAEEKDALKRLSLGLTLADSERIRRATPGAELVIPVQVVEAPLVGMFPLRSAKVSYEILAVTPPYFGIRGLQVRQGRPLCDADVTELNRVCVLGYEISNLLGAHGQIGGAVRIGDFLFKVVGVLERSEWLKGKTPSLTARNTNRGILIPIGAGQYLARSSKRHTPLDEIIVRCGEADSVTAAGAMMKSILDHEHHEVEDFHVIVPLELIRQAQETQRQFNMVLGCIAGISLLVGGIGIMNIMLATVSERTREIGVRRAVGATRSHIIFQFLVEAVLLTLTGGILGLGLGVGGARLVTIYNGWETIVTPWSIALSLGTSLLVGTFFGLYPAYKAARLDPIEALRYE